MSEVKRKYIGVKVRTPPDATTYLSFPKASIKLFINGL